jgi:RNA recognition motif-containing protein
MLFHRYCGGLAPDVTENDVRDTFYAFGEIRRYRCCFCSSLPLFLMSLSVRMVPASKCAFVTYAAREMAEKVCALLLLLLMLLLVMMQQ